MIKYKIHELLIIHDRQHLLGKTVHVAVGTLHLESRLFAEFISLTGALDVHLVYLQHYVAQHNEFLENIK